MCCAKGNVIFKTYRISRSFSESKIQRFILKILYQFQRGVISANFISYIIVYSYIISKRGVMLAIHNSSDLKSLANNAKLDPR